MWTFYKDGDIIENMAVIFLITYNIIYCSHSAEELGNHFSSLILATLPCN